MRGRIVQSFVVVAIAAAGLVAQPAHADPIPVLDQSSTEIGYEAFSCCGREWGQTFTAGKAGELSRLELYLGDAGGGFGSQGPLTVDVRRVTQGVPSIDFRDVLFQGSLAASEYTSPGFYSFDVAAAHIALQRGDRLAIVAGSAGPDVAAPWTWRFSGPDRSSYARGDMFYRNDSFASWSLEPYAHQDFAFRTFVTPTTVPEPQTLVYAATGLLGLLWGSLSRSRLRSR